MGNADTAEDIVQEAALIGLDKFDEFHPSPAAPDSADPQAPRRALSAFTAWMGQIVRYVALNHYRKQRRNRNVSLSSEHGNDGERIATRPSPPPLKLTARGQLPDDQREFDDQMMQLLAEVSDVARACLLLRTIEGMDYRHISQLLDIPEGTAMSHVHRTRKYLRDRLTPNQSSASGHRKPA